MRLATNTNNNVWIAVKERGNVWRALYTIWSGRVGAVSGVPLPVEHALKRPAYGLHSHSDREP